MSADITQLYQQHDRNCLYIYHFLVILILFIYFLLLYRKEKLYDRVSKASKKNAFIVLDRIADGGNSSGFTWHLKVPNVQGIGLRGTTFLSLNGYGEVDYVREVVEPLYKPGSAIVGSYNKICHTERHLFKFLVIFKVVA